ncbi:MKRN2 opposite strand protein-like [Ostrea edulis]|uniref:MKRN2 opposite strand protein-like n=1 Tax=Ostrea edulis TaxID=37623 RepID=UPI0024AEA414|nr:MKRN2 opposite strand protein-like [Ostrea edulis]XP_055995781.1 MKRN2 opposite strand protein-like [Ostrea edulis]
MSRQYNIPDVMCWQHCEKLTNILCFSVPPVCPLCRQNTSTSPSRIPPYKVLSPLSRAGESPVSLVVKPTVGTFLRDYDNSTNLHIGVTDTKGTVYDYDEDGVHVGVSGWEQCLVISLSNRGLAPHIIQVWDATLQHIANSKMWTKSNYIEDRHNCFDFVIAFLRQVGFSRENLSAGSRSAMTHDIILPQMSKVTQYITIYRNVERNSYICQDVQTKNLTR